MWDGSPIAHLRTLAKSVLQQDGAFEWIILDNGCRNHALRSYLQELSGRASVDVLRNETNAGIMRGLRVCLERASGRYVLPVDADDVLYPDALRVVASGALAAGYPPLLYTDEDKVIGSGVYQPYLKPDWDPVLLLNSAYIAHLGVMDRLTALDLGVYSDTQAEGSPDWDAFVRFLIAGYGAVHIPEVAYSWRVHAHSTADDAASKPYIHSSQKAVLQRFLNARPEGRNFEVDYNALFDGAAHWRLVRQHIDGEPVVTVTIKDASAKISSLASAAQQGEFVHLLGEDVQIEDPDWSWEALGLFELHPDAVMVGGRIRDKQGLIREAGQYFGFRGVCGCPYQGRPDSDPGYFGQLWKQRSVSAVAAQFAVLRANFLLELIDTIPEQASLAFLGAWAGAHALRTGKRIVYSPFLSGVSDLDWGSLVHTSEVKLFQETNRDIIPDRRFYSRHFSRHEPFKLA